MSDFDERLRAALERGAEDAPGTTGLADAARRRLTARRRRTVALGAAAAVVAVVVPTAVIVGGGGAERVAPAAPTETVRTGWATEDVGWMSFELPPGWGELDCADGWVEYGPPGGCGGDVGIWVAESDATIDMCCRPGVRTGDDGTSGGYVHVGDGLISVSGVDRDTAFHVLGSARLPGEEPVPVARWQQFDDAGLAYEAPLGGRGAWEVGAASNRMLSSRFPLHRSGARRFDGGWQVSGDLGSRRVFVRAPSEGLAELIASTVRRTP